MGHTTRFSVMMSAAAALILGLAACTSGTSMEVPELNTTPNTDVVDSAVQDDTAQTPGLIEFNEDGTFAEDTETASQWDENDPEFGTPQYSNNFAEKTVKRSNLETRYGPAVPNAFTATEWAEALGQFRDLPSGVSSDVSATDGNTIFALAQLGTVGWRAANAVKAPTSSAPKLVTEPLSAYSTQTGLTDLGSKGRAIASEVASKGANAQLSETVMSTWRLMPIGWCNPSNIGDGKCSLPFNDIRMVPESITAMKSPDGVVGARLTMVTYFTASAERQDVNVGVRASYLFWRNPDGKSPATWSFDGLIPGGWSQESTRYVPETDDEQDGDSTVRPATMFPFIVSTIFLSTLDGRASDSGEGIFGPGGPCVSDCGAPPGPGGGRPPSSGTPGGGPVVPPVCPAGVGWNTVPSTSQPGIGSATYFDSVSGREWPKYVAIKIQYRWQLVDFWAGDGDDQQSCLQVLTGVSVPVENTAWPQMMPPIECPTAYSAILQGPYNRQMQETENFRVWDTSTGGGPVSTRFGTSPNDSWRNCLSRIPIRVSYDQGPTFNGRYTGNINIKTRIVNYYYIPNVPAIFSTEAGTLQLKTIGAERDYLDNNKRWVMNCTKALQERTGMSWGDSGSFYDDNSSCPNRGGGGTRNETRYASNLICPVVSNPFYTPSDSAGTGSNTFQTRDIVEVRANNQGNNVEWRFREGTAIRTNNPDVRILGYAWSTMFQFPDGLSGVGENSPSLNPQIWKGSQSDVNSLNQPYRFGQFDDVRTKLPLNQHIGPYSEPNALGIGFRGANTDYLLNGYSASFADAATPDSYWGVTPRWTVDAVINTLVFRATGINMNVVNGNIQITPIFEETRATIEVNRSCFGEQSKMSAVRVASGKFGNDFS